VERNRKAGQNPPRVVAPTEEEEEYCVAGFGLVVKEHTVSTEIIHLHRQMHAIKRLFSIRRFHNFNRNGMSASRAV